ncbi:hypothetical protein HH310_28855 [Actinoplanes sp. TBRC 11911]|uniref:hypothetical protein n=1 Tax=Actinoplanes sp. TBRC 11911 TaxID=2729386 RepID=UPI00145EDE27|nr:hypothetical protein [Actinoplanes sp. TBRC 11911]NMO55182.1 hypothetical protein [Actinoplanes sp. TBRC 11911]
MGTPVVEAGSFACTHGGKRKLEGLSGKPGAAKVPLTVSGSPVVPVTAAGGLGQYENCGFSDNAGTLACSSTSITTTGATKLTVGGSSHVLLASDTVQSVNTRAGTITATVTAGQSTLTAK